eukprot:CAMPEP_0172514512 /NCGR_PEP_ID=MMETSP1066-20121228/260616_1 /TAXON_ID=671091 /ORGANISM="Coscinodiscus wailesii, Strain CCMP2513" /LENGTH=210 /DNA_ID=CAMNT_0013295203 /DNA_START=288 /DNA_END=920 /DNA_ORIENTATION=+
MGKGRYVNYTIGATIVKALQPVEKLQQIITSVAAPFSYMALHARVEPDMQHHAVCRDEKERNLTKIFGMLETAFPEPPSSQLFVAIARKLLVSEVQTNRDGNLLAVENLLALDYALENGLWNGRVKVFESGTVSVKGTEFDPYPAIAGSLVGYHLAVNAKVFIGTEVSSWSVDVARTRYYQGMAESNYIYLPKGVNQWTFDGMGPPPFRC